MNYKKALEECKKLSLKHGDNDINDVADLVRDIAEHNLLKDYPFKVSVWKEEDKDDILKHNIHVVKGSEIITVLKKYIHDNNYRFDMVLFENN